MSTKTREVIWGSRIMGAKMRAETARKEASKAARAADRAEAEAASAAEPNHRPVLEWRLWLAGDRALPMQDTGEHASGCHPQAA